MQRFFWAVVLLVVISGVLSSGVQAGRSGGALDDAQAEQLIRGTLKAQVEAWNRGDIPGFMQGYVRDESLRFASGNTVERGWQQTLERYQKRYDTRQKMGQLSFVDLEVRVLSSEWAEVFGRFVLKREAAVGDATGLFTLLMAREGDRWLVLHDHTSSAD